MLEELLPKPQTDLPKPLTDLPLPEKEIPAHTGASKTNIFKSKFFLGFVAFSILIAFLIGGFYLGRNSVFKELNPSIPAIPPKDPDMYKGTPTPDPTADWKTYEARNIDKTGPVRFTLKYPQTCSISKSNNILSNLEVISCPDLKIEINPEAGGRGAEVISKSEVKLGEYTWNKTEFKSGSKSNSRGVTYALTIDKEYYLIEINYEDYIAPTEDIVEQILSTFKFTNSSPVEDATGKICGDEYLMADGGNPCPSGYACDFSDPDNGPGKCIKE